MLGSSFRLRKNPQIERVSTVCHLSSPEPCVSVLFHPSFVEAPSGCEPIAWAGNALSVVGALHPAVAWCESNRTCTCGMSGDISMPQLAFYGWPEGGNPGRRIWPIWEVSPSRTGRFGRVFCTEHTVSSSLMTSLQESFHGVRRSPVARNLPTSRCDRRFTLPGAQPKWRPMKRVRYPGKLLGSISPKCKTITIFCWLVGTSPALLTVRNEVMSHHRAL
jgi:hypothetical protein